MVLDKKRAELQRIPLYPDFIFLPLGLIPASRLDSTFLLSLFDLPCGKARNPEVY